MRRVIAPVLSLALALAIGGAGCSGAIGDGEGDPGSTDDPAPSTDRRPGSGPGPSTGTGGSGAAPPPGGLIDSAPKGTPTAMQCPAPPVTPRVVRLTRKQYENSIRDLTGLDVRPSRDLPEDPVFAGFDRGLELEVGEVVSRIYRDTAESVARQVIATPAALQRVLGCDPRTGDACATTFIAEFGKRAFRRPLTDAEKTKYLALFKRGPMLVETGDAFAKGVQVTLEAMLQSPNFLYRIETASRRDGALIPLSPHEIAARLSTMLVNSTPDAALLAAADKGELATPEAVVTHARRLLATAAGKATIRDFYLQWMHVDDWAEKLTKDRTRWPGFSPALQPTLQRELELYVESVLDRGKGLQTLLTAPYTFVNRSTAPFYGAQGTFGSELQRADLDPSQRAGLLTQLGFLASHATGVQSSPIHRGVFVLRQVLCTPIPDPQEQVPALPPPSAGKTNREIVTEHTAPDGCRGCHHALINPVGFGLENYDAAGAWRTTDNGKPIDASGTLAGTERAAPFRSGVELARAVAEAPEARSCYARQWLRYSFGRMDGEGDACAVKAIADSLASDAYTARDLLVDLVRTKAFMYRTAEGQ